MEKCDITVVVATRNRALMLEGLLKTLQCQRLDGSILQVIIVNNGSTDDTEAVLARDWGLNMICLREPVAGKSRALNRALPEIAGGLVVFTDDDVTAPDEWLLSLLRARERHASATVFCGPIIPQFPPGTPTWLQQHPLCTALFAQFTPDVPEGVLPPDMLPFGPNLAVQSSAMRTLAYRLELGPSQENGPMVGEDTDFALRLRAQGEDILYVPGALVNHWVGPEKIDSSWMFMRAFYLGRSRIALYKTPRSEMAANWRQSGNLEPAEAREFTRGFILNYCCGQIHQSREDGNARLETESMRMLQDLPYQGYVDLLVPPARQVLASQPADVSTSS
jgi:glucosyl-dolichyl phosphate glucuronosyltransferase